MKEITVIKADEYLGGTKLAEFLKKNFPKQTKRLPSKIPVWLQRIETIVSRVGPRDYQKIADFIRSNNKDPKYLSYLAHIERRYTEAELRAAEILIAEFTRVFEPDGRDCGSVYDNSVRCPHCGAGRRLVSNLRLRARSFPRGVDAARTIADDEMIVTARLREAFESARLSGARFAPVFGSQRDAKPLANWFQLVISGRGGVFSQQTTMGRDPFYPPELPVWRCPNSHSVEANPLSEVKIARSTWDGSDIGLALPMRGMGGPLVPGQYIVVSNRFYQMVVKLGLKGFSFERAHLVDD